MISLIRIFLLVIVISFAGCMMSQKVKQPCPPEDAYYVVILPDGYPVKMFIEKNWFNEHREGWKTQEEYDEWYDELFQDYRKEQSTKF